MSVQAIEQIFLTKYSAHLKTLTEISLDNHDKTKPAVALCEHNTKKFFSFDDIVKDIYKLVSKPTPCTPDLILFNKPKNLIVFVEFKNGKVDSQNIRLKLLEGSLFALTNILSVECCDILKNTPIAYLLVYNYDKNLIHSRTIDDILSDLSTEEVRFGMDILKNECFKSLKTITTHPCSFKVLQKLELYGYEP